MQLLFEHSTEGDTACLGVLPRPGRAPDGQRRSCRCRTWAGTRSQRHRRRPAAAGHRAGRSPLLRAQLRRAGRRQHARDGALRPRHWPRWCGSDNFRGVQFHPERSAARRRAHPAQFPGAVTGARVLLIPSIDLRGGHCVRLLRGDFAAETRYQLEPQELLARYRRLGARWLHVVDLDGARDGTLVNRSLIHRAGRAARACGCRSAAACASAPSSMICSRTVSRAWSSAAQRWSSREQVARLAAQRYGPERICLAFDVRLDAQRRAAPAHARLAAARPRCRCGTRSRHLPTRAPARAVYRHRSRRRARPARTSRCIARRCSAFRRSSGRPPAASRSGADLAALAAHGVPAAISGKALLEERISLEELRPFLPNA